MEVKSEPEDLDYQVCRGKLPFKLLVITIGISGQLTDDNHQGLRELMNRLDAVLTGSNSWVVKCALSPQQVVEIIRRHLVGEEYVHVFTVTDELAWSGPKFVCRMLLRLGVAVDQCEAVPYPVDPNL